MGQGSQSAAQVAWLAATAAGLVLLPWYATEGARWGAPALLEAFRGRWWLLAPFVPVLGTLAARPWRLPREQAGRVLMLWASLGILAGAFLSIQAPINAELSRGLGLPVAAAASSFLAGAIVLAVVSAAVTQSQGVSIAWRVLLLLSTRATCESTRM